MISIISDFDSVYQIRRSLGESINGHPIDNSSVHKSGATWQFMSEHPISRMPQPPNSPDLASSDFYAFPIWKNRLERIQTADGDDLFEQFLELLHAIPVDELKRAFAAWINRVREGSEGNGDSMAE
jgi:transposase